MRRLLGFAPLLLTGCALLLPAAGPTIDHAGYELTCVDLPEEDCTRVADTVVELFMIGSYEYVESLTIAADGDGMLCTPSECIEIDTAGLGDPSDLP